MRLRVAVVLVILMGGIAYSQADPGIPDTVSFGTPEMIVPADSPWTGTVRVPVRVFNDEPLFGIFLVFDWTGTWTAIEGQFSGNRVKYFSESNIGFSGSQIVMQAISFDTILPDTGRLGYICFSVQDTAEIRLDPGMTTTLEQTFFAKPDGYRIYPHISNFVDTIRYTSLLPGDVNNDGNRDLSDIVALANYVFQSSFRPAALNLCDVNADCIVSVVDIVYYVNVVFRSRFTLRYGCAC